MSVFSTSQRVHVAGLPVIDADVDAALDLIWHSARRRSGNVYALMNGYSAKLRHEVPAYAEAIEDARVVPLPDGIPLSWGARLVSSDRVRRCPGPDLMEAACSRAEGTGMRFFLLGGGRGTAERLEQALKARYPGLRIAGWATPPMGEWSDEESARLAAQVLASGADVLWLGVSAPKQETWALRHASELEGIPVVCVGAAFDFLSGGKARAPLSWRRHGFEWLFRLVTEPRRLWRRYLIGNAVFVRDLWLLRSGEVPEPASVMDRAG